ncbi:NAD-dependent epimerase/dehydratase, partial [Paramagnetospirillum caucaseum]
MSRDLLLFGARTGTGLELARLARAAGWRVTAMVRPGSSAAELALLGCALVEGDALDRPQVSRAFAACSLPPVVV